VSERFYVVGGQQRPDALSRPEHERHQKGLVLEVTAPGGECRTLVEYVSPPETIPDEQPYAILFKAATLAGGRLYTCTQTEVLIYETTTWSRVGYLSHPWFNDLHHVLPRPGGTLLVAVTGLDLVLEVEPGGELLRTWGALGQDPWQRFDPKVDYRKVPTTKPHASHPNFVFETGGGIWATRFEQKDAVCLTDPRRRIAIDVERPHDGIVDGSRAYFTTVDGHVVIADLESQRVERVVDLNAIAGSPLALGWCRGLAVLDGGRRLVVGFSRLRPTRFRENVRWVKHQLGLRSTPGNLPSRIACFDFEAERLLWEENLEQHGLSVLFSIHALGEEQAR
jgi:hypothetical protein